MTSGIHHITAIASDPQLNFDFYTKILGLRLVKKSVNQDDVKTYHLFFGDRLGHPGMDLTFFTFQPIHQGKRGNGLVTKTSFTVRDDSLEFWKKRFEEKKIKHEEISESFGNRIIIFFDGDDQQLELVGIKGKELKDNKDIWTTGEIKKDNAIRSFYSATLTTSNKQLIDPILIYVFGYEQIEKYKNTYLYKTTAKSERANYIEVEEKPNSEFGESGAGTTHHIAFRARDEKHQEEMSDKLIELGLMPTEVIDRYYFKSVYFRTPSGILFEIATDGPGFTADEDESKLGINLALPPFLEDQRKEIEKNLTPIIQ